jgi:chromosomal replication initiation ATPase DnaA
MSFQPNNHNSNSNNNNNNNDRHPRRKRRWYHSTQPSIITNNTTNNPDSHEHVNKKANHSKTPSSPMITDIRQELLKKYEKDREENEKQVSIMEQQLHDFFHKTKTPYSYIDDKGIFSFTPAAENKPTQNAPQSTTSETINPFMNMTFNPFVSSNPNSLFSNTTQIPTLWTSIFPVKIVETKTDAQEPPSNAGPLNIQTVEIVEKIEDINDLIALCEKYPLAEDKKYNINMAAIHAIREPLCDLSNMVGMLTLKRTIVDQILYYLQDLHIPAVKKNTEADDVKMPEEKIPNEPKQLNPFATPFVPSFPSSIGSASAASAASTFPFPFNNIKKNPWPNAATVLGDDFALPTKGDFMHTVIYGPPGSGKTEVAKIIGRIFSNLGILNKKIFKKVSRNDLVAGYLGQTAIKTKDMIKASLGGVLFIDEAYSLGNSEKRDSFAKECVDTLCEALSEHKHNWMVIIAGYEKELNDCFFSLNEGLNSRFTWRFKLDPYKPSELKSIYNKQVRDYGWTVAKTSTNENETSASDDILPESWFASRMDYFTTYGRDMETLFTKTKIAHSRRVFCLPLSEKKIITFADLENGFKLFIENPEVNERKEKSGGGAYMKTLYL